MGPRMKGACAPRSAIIAAGIFLLSTVAGSALHVEAQGGREFVVGWDEAVTSANPFLGIYPSDYLLCSCIYDCLMYPNQDGNATPDLASSWWHMNGTYAASTGSEFGADRDASVWPDGSIWEYNLTENITWSDGDLFDASDVVFTIDLQTGANYSYFWSYRPYTRWIDHAEEIAQYKVRLFFADSGDGGKPYQLAWGDGMLIPILPSHILKELKPKFIANNWTGVPTIGTGPFMGTDGLEADIIAKEKVTLVRNPEWERFLGKAYDRSIDIDRLVMRFYADEQTLAADLKNKDVDVSRLSVDSYISLNSSTDVPTEMRLVSALSPTALSAISYWDVDTDVPGANPARLDPAVHRACALAIDRDRIIDEVYDGFAMPGASLVSPVWQEWHWDPADDENVSYFNVTDNIGNVVYSYNGSTAHVLDMNITRANEILDAAGYTWTGEVGNSMRRVGPVAAARLVAMGFAENVTVAMKGGYGDERLLEFEDSGYVATPENSATTSIIDADWELLGIAVSHNNVRTWTLGAEPITDLSETWWTGDPDPNYQLYLPTSYAALDGYNEFGIHNKAYDDLYDDQAGNLSFEGRQKWASECQKWLYLDCSMIVTAYPESCYAYNEYRWLDWGDWVQHPGLAVDHYWGGTTLLCKVKWNPDFTFNTGYILVGAALILIIAAASIVVIRRLRGPRTGKE